MAFDYGAEVAEKVNTFKKWPKDGDMCCLLDGDMLPYIVGYSTDELRAMRAIKMAQFLYGKEPDPDDWAWIECLLKQPYFEDKIDHLNFELNRWVTESKADSAKIYLTSSADNFRIDIAFSRKYKGERKKGKPPFFKEFRTYLLVKHEAILAIGEEADDLMCIEQEYQNRLLEAQGVEIGSHTHKDFANTIISTKDKDLRIRAGLHHCPTSREIFFVTTLGSLEPVWKDKQSVKFEHWPTVKGVAVNPDINKGPYDAFKRGAKKGVVKTKRVKVGYETTQYIDKLKGGGLKFFYSQLIVGDVVDNYSGIEGCGKEIAYELLNGCSSERELFETTLALYRSKYSPDNSPIWRENYRGGKALITPYQLMLEQGRLAWMQTSVGELWRDKHFCPSGVDEIWKKE